MKILEEDTIGACSIENVKMSDTKEWALRMKEKDYCIDILIFNKILLAIFAVL